MNYWFASIRTHKERFTSFANAEIYKKEKGGVIKTVPVLESEEAVKDWIQEQDNSSLYYPMYFSESSEPTLRKFYEPHNKKIQNLEIPNEIYFVVEINS